MIEQLRVLCEVKKLQCSLNENKYCYDKCGVQIECMGKNIALICKVFNDVKTEKGLCICDFERIVRENPVSDIFIVETPITHSYEAYIVPKTGVKRLVKLPPQTFSYAGSDLRDKLENSECEVVT